MSPWLLIAIGAVLGAPIGIVTTAAFTSGTMKARAHEAYQRGRTAGMQAMSGPRTHPPTAYTHQEGREWMDDIAEGLAMARSAESHGQGRQDHFNGGR